MIYLAADHRGFALKEELKKYLQNQGRDVEDAGAFSYDKTDDYVDFAGRAAERIAENPDERRGIFICGSGHGMGLAANKHKGIRANLCWNAALAKQSREHDNSNVLVLAADWTDTETAKKIVDTWLAAEFSREERHKRRLNKIQEIEEKNFK